MLLRRVGPSAIRRVVLHPGRAPTDLEVVRPGDRGSAGLEDVDDVHRVRGPARLEDDDRGRERLRDGAARRDRGRRRHMRAADKRQRAAGVQDDGGRNTRAAHGRGRREGRAHGHRHGAVTGGGLRGCAAAAVRRVAPPARRHRVGAVVARVVVHVPGSGLGRGPGQRVGRPHPAPATQQAPDFRSSLARQRRR